MYQNEFKPTTFILKMSLSEETQLERWCDIAGFVLETYAKALTETDGVYIGHIKALFQGVADDYIKLSIYKEDIPVGIEVFGSSKYREISFIINSIVYGVDEGLSLQTLKQVFVGYQNFLINYEITLIDKHDHDHNHGCELDHHHHSQGNH